MGRGEYRPYGHSDAPEAIGAEASNSPQPPVALDEFLRPQLEVLLIAGAMRDEAITLSSDFNKETDPEVRRALRLAQLAVYSYPDQTRAMLREYRFLKEEDI